MTDTPLPVTENDLRTMLSDAESAEAKPEGFRSYGHTPELDALHRFVETAYEEDGVRGQVAFDAGT